MRGLLFIVLAGCANAQTAPDAGVDAGPIPDAEVPDAVGPDAAVASGFFLDDDAADFDGTLTGAVVESWGSIAPRAYYTGGLRVRASDTGIFTDAISANWNGVEAMPFTTTMAVGRDLDIVWGSGIPAGVGLTSGDDLTMAYDGEIWLDAGVWTFYVLADDHAFLELAPIGSSTYGRVASANWSAEASGTWNATVAGWYPIRFAHCERTVGAQLRVELSGPSVVRGPVSRHRLRFVASGLTGLTVGAFDDGRLTGDHTASIDRVAPAGRYYGASPPSDLGVTSGDDFSVRWAGQLRIDVAGDYALRYLSEDGHRLWVDGALVLDQWDDASHDTTTDPITLAEGWHDLVVDHHESTGNAQAFLGVASGPDLVAAQLPPERLRPVETRGERYDTGVDHTDRAIPDLGQAESAILIDAPAGAKAYGVDVGWTFDHAWRSDLEVTLVAPDGSSVILRDHDNSDGNAGSVTQRVRTTALDEATASGIWRLRVDDTISLDTGTLRDFTLTVHHRAGQPPITEQATYESSIKDLGVMVTAYQAFSWHAALGPGTEVRFYVRSGDSPADVAAAAWSSPIVDPDGGPPPAPARRYFQYRIELDSEGDGSALVDWVRLDVQEEIP